ncbi:MAG: hypothetical protein BGO70_01705 [Bacteroidetes bacterium 43-93]|nr:hypothetical protein [Bacteroidota bacterium]OJW96422.1 MAG: hypothetical protein BGO70_01705 [Bacteroidetes bacterium 43-93]
MEENRKHIDKLFREELGNYTETPSPAVWEALEKRLDAHYAPKVKAPVRSYSWVWYALAAAIVAMVLYFVLSGAVKRSHSESPAINKGTGYADNTTPSPAAIQDHGLSKEDHSNEQATKTAENNIGDTSSAGKSNTASPARALNPMQPNALVNASAKATHTTAADHHSTTSNKQVIQNNTQVPGSNVAKHGRKGKKSAPGGNNNSVATNKSEDAGIRDNSKDTPPNTSEPSSSGIVEKDKTSTGATAATGKTSNNVQSTSSATRANNNPVSKTPASKKAGGRKYTSSKKELKGETALNAPGEIEATPNNTVAKTAKNVPGAKSLTENTYSGGNAATTNKSSKNTGSNVARKKAGGIADKPANRNITAKKSSRPANKMTDQLQEPDQGPDVSFDNTTGNKSKKEQEVAKAEEKPKIDWQKGFKADEDRGIKKVSAGNESGNASSASTQDGSDKVAQSGGGGAAAGYGEKEKKKKKDRSETSKKPFDFGAKLGFEKGFGSYQANKLVLAPYLQFRIASNISVIAQPTVKYAMINKNVLDDPQSYYRTGSSSLDSNHTIKTAPDSFATDTISRRYYLHQSHDSIVVTRSIKQKSYIEFELPILLQFKVSKSFSPYLGVTMNYSTIVNSADDQKTYSGITRNDSVIYAPVSVNAPAPAKPNPGSSFQYNGTPFSQYTPGPSSAPSSMFRFSYSVGFNYLVNNRLFFDLMYTKTFSSLTGIQDTRIREIYNQGYLRLSVGYRLGK